MNRSAATAEVCFTDLQVKTVAMHAMRWTDHQKEHLQTLASELRPALRFAVGTRVLAHVGDDMQPGIVTQQYYTEPGWPEGKVAPYQILLDDGEQCVFALHDEDWQVKLREQATEV